ncbi:N-acetylmuramoyl-L-alanine amidase [Mangrovactinospora gilvigrisea]|uniref:N-acetylmuramoyl-L-alanine amidase n=1 Tax=Mangrovactinospora gilvigrisea TaxID=1428644 RepID=A0A1J7C6N7_9ACTN|nr:N-acetylmuramoyl-L-alanine amidase [Mangrovactinospora gilvigrisea]OIV37232.1 N-acetylmuramoyl-L-alanine amidase [Mangrovactinospora gilvigrisea]
MTQQRPPSPRPLWRLGDSGPAVAEIRRKLVRLNLLPEQEQAEGADAFTAAVDAAVRHFQQQRALIVDGIVGPETYRHLDEARHRLGDRILTHWVGRPMVGDDIAELQQRLLDMGFTPGLVDGIYGARTGHAVREFQRNIGLVTDGTCGPSTYRALANLTRTVTGGQPQAMRETEHLLRAGPALAGKVLVLDPGHGGDDTGVEAHGMTEADQVWQLTTRLEGRLTALGVRTYLTRPENGQGSVVSEEERASFANATDADLVISLHVDGHANPGANGVAAYYYGHDTRYSPTGQQFAGLAQRELVARCGFGDDRIHGKTWSLLRGTRMPAVRLEIGYLTHYGDAGRLLTRREEIVESIAVAVQRLFLPPEDDEPTGMLRLPSILL